MYKFSIYFFATATTTAITFTDFSLLAAAVTVACVCMCLGQIFHTDSISKKGGIAQEEVVYNLSFFSPSELLINNTIAY